MESDDPNLAGYPAILAGRAIVDVGVESFKKKVVRDVREDLHDVMQDRDPETSQPRVKPYIPITTRAYTFSQPVFIAVWGPASKESGELMVVQRADNNF